MKSVETKILRNLNYGSSFAGECGRTILDLQWKTLDAFGNMTVGISYGKIEEENLGINKKEGVISDETNPIVILGF